MTLPRDSNWLFDIAKGKITGHSVVHKFGRNAAVGTSFVPVTIGGVYQTPQPASATTLRIKAGGNAADTADGNGAREVTLQGLDANGDLVTEAIATAGASASSATSASFMRLFRAWVSASGTYATQSTGSHTAGITIENSGGGTDWLTIDATDFPKGQSEVAVYSVPDGFDAYIMAGLLATDSSKTTDMILFRRENIVDAAAPYDAMRALLVFQSTGAIVAFNPESPIKVNGPADIGWMAKVDAGTAQVSIDYEMILVKN